MASRGGDHQGPPGREEGPGSGDEGVPVLNPYLADILAGNGSPSGRSPPPEEEEDGSSRPRRSWPEKSSTSPGPPTHHSGGHSHGPEFDSGA
eukprot:CAMPEP_0174942030 /NCGR_PEP_ID=MMETSP1355-20121228/73242_1 /TAXON_ID=464990 /ORGANISM="Hemiselmis tepida, Strain CCMP443" /LENGTH=91 /DNA_ID=CAMNT_0016189177 /DNA_START=146 /DNA_END=418 /DNA_ORIENTATION=+